MACTPSTSRRPTRSGGTARRLRVHAGHDPADLSPASASPGRSREPVGRPHDRQQPGHPGRTDRPEYHRHARGDGPDGAVDEHRHLPVHRRAAGAGRQHADRQATDAAGNTSQFQATIHRDPPPGGVNQVIFWNQVELQAIENDASTPGVRLARAGDGLGGGLRRGQRDRRHAGLLRLAEGAGRRLGRRGRRLGVVHGSVLPLPGAAVVLRLPS